MGWQLSCEASQIPAFGTGELRSGLRGPGEDYEQERGGGRVVGVQRRAREEGQVEGRQRGRLRERLHGVLNVRK